MCVFTLLFSCEKQETHVTKHESQVELVLQSNQIGGNYISNDKNIQKREPHSSTQQTSPPDCQCFMRVNEITPINYGSNPPWFIIDVTDNPPIPDWEFEGNSATTYLDFSQNPSGTVMPLPTPYNELNTPSDGTHMFYAGGSFQSPPDYENGENLIIKTSYYCQYWDGNNLYAGGSGNLDISLADGEDTGLGYQRIFIDFECIDPQGGIGIGM